MRETSLQEGRECGDFRRQHPKPECNKQEVILIDGGWGEMWDVGWKDAVAE